jgi:hypothetical protein
MSGQGLAATVTHPVTEKAVEKGRNRMFRIG